ncbi:hypothetical protein MKW92_006343 [Papaver armeniacum]|nr:hypothetical protein MKW92_006343 [Papaver armeniacum]
MIDAAKYADLVLLLVDASFGFEAETFEFFDLLRVHGLPKVMGVLTHILDQLEGEIELSETIKRLQDHSGLKYVKEQQYPTYLVLMTMTCTKCWKYKNLHKPYQCSNSVPCHGEPNILICW